MADNSSLPVASGNETFANDDIGGVKYPRPKVNWGPDGTANDVDVASGKPLPVQLRGSDGTDRSNKMPVSIASGDGFYTEDAAAASDPVGPALIGVRRDTLSTSEVSADGDNIAIKATSRGQMHVANADGSGNLLTSATRGAERALSVQVVDSGGSQVTSFGNGTQYTEDAAAATDPVGNMLMAVRRDTLSASEVSADGDNIALKATSKGKLHVAAELRAGDAVLDTGTGTGGSSTIRVAVDTASQTAQVANNADAVASSASLLYIPTVSYLFGYNGTTYDRLQVDANKYLKTAPQAGELHLGEVGGNTTLFSVTPTLDTSAYAAGDVLFDRTVLTNFFRKNDGTGILQSIQVIDGDDNGVAIDFYLQTTNQTLGTANAAPSISDANAAEILGPFSIAAADYKDLGGVKVGKITGLAQTIKSVSGARTLYISAVVTSGTPTFTASGIVLRLGALLD